MLSLSDLKDKKHIIKPLVIIVIVLALDFIFILRGQIIFLAKTVPQANKLNKDINTAKIDIASKDSLMKRYENLNSAVVKIKKKIIQEQEISLFLGEVSQIAKDSKVRLMQIRPSSLTTEEAKDTQGVAYYRLPIELDLKSGYHRLALFINKLETSKRHIKVLNFDVVSVMDPPFEYSVRMTIETYVLRK